MNWFLYICGLPITEGNMVTCHPLDFVRLQQRVVGRSEQGVHPILSMWRSQRVRLRSVIPSTEIPRWNLQELGSCPAADRPSLQESPGAEESFLSRCSGSGEALLGFFLTIDSFTLAFLLPLSPFTEFKK